MMQPQMNQQPNPGTPPPGGQPPMQEQAPAPVESGENPVADAFQTIAMWVSGQAESGNPKAQAMQSALQQLVASIVGNEGREPGSPPPQAPAPQESRQVPVGQQQQAPQGARDNMQPVRGVKPVPVM